MKARIRKESGLHLFDMNDLERIERFRREFPAEGFFQDKEWVLSPRAFALPEEVVREIRELGPALRRFQRACNRMYLEGVDGGELGWVTALLDQGKPESVVALGRERAWRDELPGVIRPDLMMTEDGVKIAELDSLPGGIGLTAWLNETYAGLGEAVIGGATGMVEGFRRAFPDEAILVSRESADYEPEMRWLAGRLGDGREVLNPWSMDLKGLEGRAVYRFFELFDLANVEQSEGLLGMAREGRVRITPPIKAYLEEKLWLALFWAPALTGHWERLMEEGDLALLRRCIPEGWVVDATEMPVSGEIRGLGVASWDEVGELGRKERELVVKVSGFSELGWGSRGVSIGHDLSQGEWKEALKEALAGYGERPFLMQRFHAARVVEHPAWDEAAGVARLVRSRARLCPYYFAGRGEEDVVLGGILATVCPADKKLLHGMRDAMMLPCVAG
jgi:hypothetical protein